MSAHDLRSWIMKFLLTLVALAGVLVVMVPQAQGRTYKNGRNRARAYVGSHGIGGYRIYSTSPAIRYRHNIGRKYRYHHEQPYPYYRSAPRYFTGSPYYRHSGAPYYRHRGYYRFGSTGPYYGNRYNCR